MVRKFSLIFLLFSVGFAAKAQLSYDLVQFGADYEKYIESLGDKPTQESMGDFLGFYNTGRLTNPQKMSVIKLSNQMVNLHMGAPTFNDYLRSMNGLIENNQVGKFDTWHKALNLSLSQSKDEFKEFLKISRNIFADHIIFEQGVMKWVSSNIDINLQTKGEAAFVVKNTDLICYTTGDTLEIYRTSGVYYPNRKKWIGTGGKIDWTRVGTDSAKMYADLVKYSIDFTSGFVTADTALFYYPMLFEKPIAGKVIDRPMTQSMGERSTYPQFSSFQAVLKDFPFGRAKFTGGFGMKGKTIIGTSVDSIKAQMVFSYKDKPVFKVRAKELIVRGDKVHTQKSELIILLDKDSIYHPQVEFTYRLKDAFVSVYRSDQGISQAPFFDTYHNIEFYCDEIRWPLDNPKIDIDMINDNQPAKFESNNYFRDVRYEKVQGLLDYNPLVRVKQYTEKLKITGFYIEDYANFFKSNKSDIKIQMIELNDKGFISYDSEKEYVKVRRKLQDYVNAHAGRTDFDAIAFFSIIKRYPNASLSLINNDLIVQGVPKFYFSDSQNVYIIPKDQQITIKKNRNMDFSGKLHAGKVEFFGNGFAFDYNMFQIRLSNVDSMKFFYKDEKTGMDLPIKSALQNIYGTLSIDHPFNKSSRKKFPGYPIFKSETGANIYYDKVTTYNGIYNRNRFSFKLDPFTLDSLNELNFETIKLEGTFLAGGIIPDMRADLNLQEDKSLGFKITEATYPMYGGKGTGTIALYLSDSGFFGNGKLDYLTSTSSSHKFELFLDSVNAHCDAFENKRNTLFPTVSAVNTYERWMPYGDSLLVLDKDIDMQVSDKRSFFNGTLLLTPGAMTGNGHVDIDKARLIATLLYLKPDNILTDSGFFQLKSHIDSTKFAFMSGSVKANINLTSRKGDFVLNTQGINTDFTFNQYVGSFEDFTWFMDDEKIDFKSVIQGEEPSSYLVSVRTVQEGLTYKTGLTTLDLKDYSLYAKKIPFIAVGDAHIFPDSQKVVIREGANIDEIYHSKIIADTLSKFHKIEEATLRIEGKFALKGTGTYEYMDQKKNKQKFFLNEITIDAQHQLMAKTDIPDSIKFNAGTNIRFQGRVVLRSIEKNLEYDGFFLPTHALSYPRTDWFRNKAIINPDSVFINLQPTLTNQNKQALTNGFYISNDSAHAYAAFFTRKRNGSDPELMKVEGVLYYDEKDKEFRMGSTDKLFKDGLKGNVLKVNEGKQTTTGEGRFKFGYETGKFEFTTAGTAVLDASDTSFKMHLAGLLNFPIPAAALKLMYDSLYNQSDNGEIPSFKSDFMKKAVAELVDDKFVGRATEEIEENSVKATPDLQKTIFISELHLKWSPVSRSLISVGNIGINSFDKYRLERQVKGRLEMTKRRSGDDFVLYIQSPQNGSWYFFKYQRNILYVVGSDALFNTYIKDNIDKLSKDEFKLRQANIADRNRYVKAMKKTQ
ncbi:MAG: hypothetical protein V4590_03250 [Bacteroidota bacterium]